MNASNVVVFVPLGYCDQKEKKRKGFRRLRCSDYVPDPEFHPICKDKWRKSLHQNVRCTWYYNNYWYIDAGKGIEIRLHHKRRRQ